MPNAGRREKGPKCRRVGSSASGTTGHGQVCVKHAPLTCVTYMYGHYQTWRWREVSLGRNLCMLAFDKYLGVL